MTRQHNGPRGYDPISHAKRHPVLCAQPQCPRSYPSGKWGSIRAHAEGWFLQVDGTSWCPDHIPAWVWAWRARRARGDGGAS